MKLTIATKWNDKTHVFYYIVINSIFLLIFLTTFFVNNFIVKKGLDFVNILTQKSMYMFPKCLLYSLASFRSKIKSKQNFRKLSINLFFFLNKSLEHDKNYVKCLKKLKRSL